MNKNIKKILKGLWSCNLLIFAGYFIIQGILAEDFIHQIGYCLYAMGFLIINECRDIKEKLNKMRDNHIKSDTSVVEILTATTDALKKVINKNKEDKQYE
jgi:hypothetical protein